MPLQDVNLKLVRIFCWPLPVQHGTTPEEHRQKRCLAGFQALCGASKALNYT
jgi:hypothetical protein